MTGRVAVLSRGVWGLRREIGALLGAEVVRGFGRAEAVVDWADGRGAAARRWAALTGRPFRGVRVGPLAAVRPFSEPPMSLVLDGAAMRAGDARDGLALLRRLRLAWRNDGRDRAPGVGRAVLVVAGTDPAATDALLRRARREVPGATPLLLPDARVPDGRVAPRAGAAVLAWVNPWAAFDAAERVFAGTAELGDLARLAGRQVDDDPPPADAAATFRARFLDGVAYLDAWSRAPVPFAEAASQLAWLRDRFLDNERRAFCVGITAWKAARVARFLDGPDGPAARPRSAGAAVAAARDVGGAVVAWATRMPASLAADCAAAGVPLLRMEDGFLRSVGLGSAFLPGDSAVLDGRGIYFDPRAPSDLEHLLATAEFPPDLLERAAALRRLVVGLRLSKYNVGRAAVPDLPPGRRVVLVPGQVEDDLSVRHGSPGLRTNLALLEAARARHPDAAILFRPHPDVAARLRRGAVPEAEVARLADGVAAEAAMADLLERVNAVETMTSLAGFEALLRGVAVTTHGRPFYAGWGLTTDLDPPPRRGRRLALDELVAGALLLYPRYLDPVTGLRCPPEVLVRRLAAARDAAAAGPPPRARLAYARARHALFGPLAAALRRARGVRP